MKTVTDIDREIEMLAAQVKADRSAWLHRAAKRLESRIAYLRQCRRYLETNPTQETMQRDLDNLTFRRKAIEDGYENWKKWKAAGGEPNKAEYHTMFHVAELERQIKTLQYLLN